MSYRFRRKLTRSLPAGLLLVRAYLRILLVDLELRTFGFQHLLRRARPAAANSQPVTIDAKRRAVRYARAIARAARYHVAPARCLHRSAALHLWLAGEGLPSELRIGVQREGHALYAHAWVELAGRIINDQPSAVGAFTPLFSSSPPAPVLAGAMSAAMAGRNSELGKEA